jgi:hypothetical protein
MNYSRANYSIWGSQLGDELLQGELFYLGTPICGWTIPGWTIRFWDPIGWWTIPGQTIQFVGPNLGTNYCMAIYSIWEPQSQIVRLFVHRPRTGWASRTVHVILALEIICVEFINLQSRRHVYVLDRNNFCQPRRFCSKSRGVHMATFGWKPKESYDHLTPLHGP